MENRAYFEMKKAAVLRLQKKSIEEICKTTGVQYDARRSELKVPTLGQLVTVHYPSWEIANPLEEWHSLLLWHYLDMADGTRPSGDWVSFGGLKDGLIRGTKYDHTMELELQKFLAGKNQDQLVRIFEKLGAEFTETRADLSPVLYMFPFYPIRLNIWLEDEEFPAAGKLLVDKNADHCLTIEDAVTAGDVLLRTLEAAAAEL